MKKKNKIIWFLFVLFLTVISCKKETPEVSDLEKVRNNNNQKTYPVTKMDSVQAISFITKQKNTGITRLIFALYLWKPRYRNRFCNL